MRIFVEKWVQGGLGMGRLPDGKVIFLAEGIPGDTFFVNEFEKRKGVFWSKSAALIDPSPHRLESPRCPHFSSCGGCALLHVPEQTEEKWKTELVQDCLRRIAKIDPQTSFISFPLQGSRYRGRFRIESQQPPGFSLRASHKLSPIQLCKVLAPQILDDLPELERFFCQHHYQGFLYFAADQNQQWIASFEGPKKPKVKSGHLMGVDTKATLKFDWHGFSPIISSRSFFQSNPASWPGFWQKVTDFMSEFNIKKVWDVHAGSGFLSVAANAEKLWASEPDQFACQNLRRLAKLQPNMVVLEMTAEQASKKIPISQLDGLILDPPRSGLSTILRRQIVDCGPAHILYISCDIASFSRDLRELSNAYEIHWPLSVWNVNPGTARVETALTLSRKAKRR